MDACQAFRGSYLKRDATPKPGWLGLWITKIRVSTRFLRAQYRLRSSLFPPDQKHSKLQVSIEDFCFEQLDRSQLLPFSPAFPSPL